MDNRYNPIFANINNLYAPEGSLLSIGAGVPVAITGTNEVKSLVAGSNITILDLGDEVSISSSSSGGTLTAVNNVGGGDFLVKTSGPTTAEIRSLVGAGNITITQNTDDLTISSSSTDVSLTNAGSGTSLVNDGTGPALAIKSLTAGTNITFSPSDATNITINSTGGGSLSEYQPNVLGGGYGRISNTLSSVSLGYNSMLNPPTSSINNVCVGTGSLTTLNNCNSNVVIGNSCQLATGSIQNSIVGNNCNVISNSDNCIGVGYNNNFSAGSNTVLIGTQSGSSHLNNIILGGRVYNTTQNDTIFIGNSNITNCYIDQLFGDSVQEEGEFNTVYNPTTQELKYYNQLYSRTISNVFNTDANGRIAWNYSGLSLSYTPQVMAIASNPGINNVLYVCQIYSISTTQTEVQVFSNFVTPAGSGISVHIMINY